MKKNIIIFSIALIAFLATTTAHAGDLYTKNIGFETGSFTDNWSSYISCVSSNNLAFNFKNQLWALPNSRITIMTDKNEYDANTGNKLKTIPEGYNYSVRLGNNDYSFGWSQNLKYKMKVDSTNNLLIVKFAGVFNDPNYSFIPNTNNFSFGTPSDCGLVLNIFYQVSKNQTPWHKYNYTKWCDWTTVGFLLNDFVGDSISIDFNTSQALSRSGETPKFSFIYFVAETHPAMITVKYCPNDTIATLTAPEGFYQYKWYIGNTVLDSSQVLVVKKPVVGDNYICMARSYETELSKCEEYFTVKIPKVEPLSAEFTTNPIDCNHLTDTVHFTSLQPVKNRKLIYKWDFGDGTTSSEQNPKHVYNSSGLHKVHMTIIAPPTLCSETSSKMVETFSPHMVGISGDTTYCEGYTNILKGYGAHRYKWSNGSTADSIEVGKDTTIWMIGYSSNGCSSDTIRFKIKKEPDWVFTTDGKEAYCQGEYTVLWGNGAVYYKWSNGATISSITVKKPGVYTVVASNLRGCEKSKTFNVIEYPKPDVNFSMSTNTISSRHNEMVCSVPFESSVQYNWDMGDGTTEYGSSIQHIFNNTADILGFNNIILKAVNSQGCIDTISKRFEITPFIPSVFSPNGDGINDLFMEGYDLSIFDRSGIVVYKGKAGWNGTYMGKKLGNDTYFYTLNYKDKDHQIVTVKGYITLKR